MDVRALGLILPMVMTKTNHVAINILGEHGRTLQEPKAGQLPFCQSEKEDLYLYLVEEASTPLGRYDFMREAAYEVRSSSKKTSRVPRLGVRGILPKDEKKEMSHRRSKELEEAGKRIAVEDRRTWIALKRSYTYAEQAATNQFQNTVIFEPFGGSFGVTRLASSQFGWTCSQPMDIMDGYDLLDPKGKRMLFETLRVHRPYCVIVAFDCKLWSLLNNLKSDPEMLQEMRETIGRKSLKLLVEICIWQHDHGRFFLVENPAGSLAWVWEDLLRRLLSRCLAKFVISDQCAYGKVDLESGKPIRKPTGWLSNDEVLLNHLGKRCTCKWGSHQLVLGNNKFGRRSSQAAAYPVGLCKAICQGVLDSMKIGYASRVVEDLSFAGGEDLLSEPAMETDENLEELQLDSWQSLPGKIVRHHLAPRLALFSPMSVDGMPCDFQDILPRRVTFLKYEDGTEEKFEDEWTSPDDPIKRQGKYWTGRTEVDVKEPVQDSALPESAPPFLEDGPEIAGGDGLRTPADGLRSPGDDGLRNKGQGRQQLQVEEMPL